MYRICYTENAVKALSKLDKPTLRIIKHWINKNLIDTIDPRMHGKALTGNLSGIWRYRIGNYRLFARIEDEKLTVIIFDVGHRNEIYKRK